MLNTFQSQTKSGKPVVNKQTKLPMFKQSSFRRINELKEQILGFKITKNLTHDQRFALIQLETMVMVENTMPQLT